MPDATDDIERSLKLEQIQMDIELKRKQTAWETPRNIAFLAGTVAAVVGVLAGVLGFKLGQQPQAPQFPSHITVELRPPNSK